MDSNQVRREWAERTGEYSPEYYAYYGPDETSETIRGLLDRFVERDAAVLELGCSSGRHLSHLHDHGYENLAGIEVNADAIDVMAEHYPDLAAEGAFYLDAIETVVGDFEDGRFDVVYSVETLQHLHPDVEWVFGELARITGDLLVTVENEGMADSEGGDEVNDSDERGDEVNDSEGGDEVNYVDEGVPLYYRDWNRVFTDLGLVEVERSSTERDTIRAFRRPR
ncbi:MAG: class I SAM-dependent methyltransferase [Halolamina sp.]